MTESLSQSTCPMANMCRGIAGKSSSGMVLLIPGLILICIGVLVLFQPKILAWLIAILMIMMGIGVLFMANMMRKLGDRMRSGETE